MVRMMETKSITPKILVVDDDEWVRSLCTMFLDREGYEVAVAETGEQGLRMIDEVHYDVVLLDLVMPDFSGFQTLPELTKKHPDTAVVIITGHATIENTIEVMRLGAFDVIAKPIDRDQLRAVVIKSLKYIGALQDIFDSRSRLRLLVERMNDGVFTVDLEGCVIIANQAFLDMGLCEESDIIGREFSSVCDRSDISAIFQNALAGSENECCDIVVMDKEGKERFLAAHGAPFKNRIGEILGATIVFHDITARVEIDKMKVRCCCHGFS